MIIIGFSGKNLKTPLRRSIWSAKLIKAINSLKNVFCPTSFEASRTSFTSTPITKTKG